MALLKTNTGIGTTNPTSALHVIGDVLVTGVVTATTFNGNINTGVATITTATITNLTNTRLTSGIGTINNLINNLLTSGIGSVATLYSTNSYINVGVVTDISGTRLNYTGVGTITTFDSDTATINNVSSDYNNTGVGTVTILSSGIATVTNLNNTFLTVSGIGSVANLHSPNAAINVGVITDLTNTRLTSGIATITDLDVINSSFSNVNVDNLYAVTGIVTDISGTRLNYTGVGTITTLDTDTGVINNLSSDYINVGVATAAILNSGIGTIVDLNNTRFVSGISTITTLDTDTGVINNLSSDYINVGVATASILNSGIATVTNLNNTFLNVSGVGSITTLNSTHTNLTNINATGISTLADIRAQRVTVTGIVTANSFRPTSGYIQAADGTNSFYIYDTTGNVAFQGTIGVNQINNAGGYQVITFNNLDTQLTGNLDIAGVTTSSVFNGNIYSLGVSTFRNGPILIGTASSTGTAFQPLQVTGGAYVSNNLGIGITTPTSKLDVVGDGRFTGVVTATTFNGQINAGVSTLGVATAINLTSQHLIVSGLSTFVGVTTFQNDVYIGGDLYVTDDIIFDEFTARNINVTGVATIFNLVGTAATVVDLTNTRLTSGIATITDLDVTNSTFDNLNTTNLNAVTGVVTTLSGTDITYTNSDFTNLNANNAYIDVGIVTDISGTRLNYTGVGTITTFNSTNAGINSLSSAFINAGIITANVLNAPIAYITDLTNIRLVSGISTITTLKVTNLDSHTANIGVGIVTNISGINLNYTGLSTISTLDTTNATIDYLTNTNLTVSGIATIQDLDVQGQFDVYDTTATFHNNVFIAGNLSIGGTATTVITQDLKVFDREITLGITTNALGQDVSNDITANHGGIAIASTEGSPLVNLTLAGFSSIPPTYKQLMWVAANSYGVGTTDAWMFNYAVGIGSTLVPNDVRLAVGEVQITDHQIDAVTAEFDRLTSGIATITGANISNLHSNNIFAQSGIITGLSGTRLNYTGFGTITNLYSNSAYIENVNSNVGFATAFTSERLNVTGVGTIATFNSTTSTITNLNVTNSSFSNVNVNNLYAVAGIITTLTSTNSNLTNINSVGISTLGVTTTTNLSAQQLNVAGVSTFVGVVNANNGINGNLTGIAASATTIQITANSSDDNVYYIPFETGIGYTSLYIDSGLTYNPGQNLLTLNNVSSVNINVNENLYSGGITTLAANGGITTTGGNLYVGSDLYVKDDIFFDESTARNINVTGISSVNILTANQIKSVGVITAPTFVGDLLGVANYAHISGFSTFSGYANTSGVSTFSGYANNAGIATYAWTAGVSTYSGISGYSTFSGYSNTSGFSTFSGYSNTSGFSTFSGYSNASGVSTFSGYANNAGIATYAWTAGVSTYAGLAGISTNVIGGIASVSQLNVSGVTTVGFITASQLVVSGVATINQLDVNQLSPDGTNYGVINFVPVADGVGTWSWQPVTSAGAGTLDGITLREEGSTVGTAGSITNLDFRGNNIVVTAIPLGAIATITASDTPTFDTLNVTGISTLGFTTVSTLYVSGVSTFSGISTFGGDVYIGANLYVQNDVVFDEFTARNVNVTGISSVNILTANQIKSVGVVTAPTFVGDLLGVSNYAHVSGFSTFSGYSNTSGFSTFSNYSTVSGLSSFSKYADAAGFSTFSGYANASGVSTFSGYANASGVSTFADYANNSGISTYAWTAGVSTYSGVAGYSTFSGYANVAGVSTNVIGGIGSLLELNVSGITTLASSGGITTTGGDLYVGGDLYINDDLVFDEFTARNITVTGTSSLGIASASSLYVTGLSTFVGFVTFTNNVSIANSLDVKGNINFNGALYQNGTLFTAGIGIGSTSVNPQSGVVNQRVGVGFTDLNIVGTGISVTGYGSTVVIDFGNIAAASGGALSISTVFAPRIQDVTFVGGATTSRIGISTQTDRFVYDTQTGSVGIGTSSASIPSYKLDVIGDINSSTSVKIKGVDVLEEAVRLAIALG